MIISKTPLRLSFVGGGTDLPDFYENYSKYGTVISTAIDKYIYRTVNRKFDKKIRLSYSKTEIVDHIDDLEHNIIREALRHVGIKDSIEVVYMADLPLSGGGSGLGSSSSLAVGTLKALYALIGKFVSNEQLAEEAFYIEKDVLKNPIGKQDQYAAAFGGLNQIKFFRGGDVSVEPLICHPNMHNLIRSELFLVYTGIARFASDILQNQKKEMEKKLDLYENLVVMVEEFGLAIKTGDIAKCHEIMRQSWEKKKQLSSKISTNEIDSWCEKGLNAGAAACKIAGAGGGGFMFFMCDEEVKTKIASALRGLVCLDVSIEQNGSQIIHASA